MSESQNAGMEERIEITDGKTRLVVTRSYLKKKWMLLEKQTEQRDPPPLRSETNDEQ
jgi:hypothetical protein